MLPHRSSGCRPLAFNAPMQFDVEFDRWLLSGQHMRTHRRPGTIQLPCPHPNRLAIGIDRQDAAQAHTEALKALFHPAAGRIQRIVVVTVDDDLHVHDWASVSRSATP